MKTSLKWNGDDGVSADAVVDPKTNLSPLD